MRIARSYLYVPGNAPQRFAKAFSSGADAVILDLEDAVPWAGKDAARDEVRGWLLERTADNRQPRGTELWVRVNPGDERVHDLASLEGISGLTGVVLAKTQSAADVSSVAQTFAEQGHSDRWISPLLETPAAILDVRQIASQPRVQRLQIGEYDLCAEAGITPGIDEAEVVPARMQVVFASAAVGLAPPIAPVSIEIKDIARFAETTRTAARQGFVGRACIHPAQLEPVHAAFTPSDQTVAAAEKILVWFESQINAGAAAVMDEHGRLIDEAVVRQARRTLSLAALPPR